MPKKPSRKTAKAAKSAKPSHKAPAAVKKLESAPKPARKGGASLLIVESPAKERTISRFLNKGFVVRSSYGHVRDLPVRKIGVEPENNFEPQYVVLPRAKKILADLKTLVAKSSHVYLATDHDREGESIAWHLADTLKLSPEQVRRITFHEITPSAIQEAVAHPRGIDANLVQAQQARRVIDRLVGYKLSPLLWAKIQSGLSAGRVQSAAVRLIVERQKEMGEFQSEPYWTLTAVLEKPGAPPNFSARLVLWQGEKVETSKSYDLFSEPYRVKATILRGRQDVEAIAQALKAGDFKVRGVEAKEARRRPAPPFSTSTLQQAASQRLGFAAERTMRAAQALYEGVDLGGNEPAGLITYMRTDSFSVSALAAAEAARFIRGSYGADFAPAQPPTYQTKSRGAQEAHEAIRPTSVLRSPEEMRRYLPPDQARLYELIWKRFVASQMSEAVYDTVSAEIENDGAVFRCAGRTLKFEGYLRVYRGAAKTGEEEPEEEPEGEEEGRLPPLSVGDALRLVELKPEEHKTSPPPYYNEASLIRAMEKHGIGRPSTYAPTIKTIVDRGYVRRGMKDRRLTATDLGTLVTEKLKSHFPDVVSLRYTADVEEKLDEIAEGHAAWTGVVREFYQPFVKALDAAADAMPVSRVEPKTSDEKCPLCGSPMLIRESRFGKYLSCSTFPKCKGKVQLDAEGRKIVLESAGENCDLCGKPMIIRTGRKGRFMACSGYPSCRNTFSLDAEGRKIEGSRPLPTTRPCNKCGKLMWLRMGKRGFFLTCPGYPKCRNLKPLSKDEGGRLKAEGESLRVSQAAPPGGGAAPAA